MTRRFSVAAVTVFAAVQLALLWLAVTHRVEQPTVPQPDNSACRYAAETGGEMSWRWYDWSQARKSGDEALATEKADRVNQANAHFRELYEQCLGHPLSDAATDGQVKK